MATTAVTIDTSLGERLKAANEHTVEFRDPEGNIVGFFVSPHRMEKLEEYRATVNRWLDRLWPQEEIARITERARTNPNPKIPNEVVMQWVEGL